MKIERGRENFPKQERQMVLCTNRNIIQVFFASLHIEMLIREKIIHKKRERCYSTWKKGSEMR